MSLTQSIIDQYPGKTYVETGIWRGDSLQMAINTGYKNVIGIDNDPECIEFCKNRFDIHGKPGKLRPKLILGDSATMLYDVCKDIDGKITFLFDAHWQFLEGTEKGDNPFPLLDELAQVWKLDRSDHTLIIDDWHIFYTDRVGYSKERVRAVIMSINDDYTIRYFANPVIDNLIVAHV